MQSSIGIFSASGLRNERHSNFIGDSKAAWIWQTALCSSAHTAISYHGHLDIQSLFEMRSSVGIDEVMMQAQAGRKRQMQEAMVNKQNRTLRLWLATSRHQNLAKMACSDSFCLSSQLDHPQVYLMEAAVSFLHQTSLSSISMIRPPGSPQVIRLMGNGGQ